MNKLKLVFALYALLFGAALYTNIALAEESQREKGQQFREERRKKILEEKCHGDASCEAEMKRKFEEKRKKIHQAMEQCGQDETCRKETRQKMIQEFKEKRKEHQQKIRENPKK